MKEKPNKSSDSAVSGDMSADTHPICDSLVRDELDTEPDLSQNSTVKFDETTNTDGGNCSTLESSQVVEEDDDASLFQSKKRLKMTQPSDPSVVQVDGGSPVAHEIRKSSLDQPLESGSDATCFSQCMVNASNAAEHELSVEIGENYVAKSNVGAGENHESDFNHHCCSAADLLSGDTHLQHKEQSLPLNTDSTSEVTGGTASTAIDRASGNSRKKLLVLDLNGLLLDISSYIPYDYDHDEIINRKAVFKRPHCDDFLRFCFEKFNVGIWSSRFKRNVEPILDYLLRDDKQKLAFIWDYSHCADSGFHTLDRRGKPLLVKKLKKLWDKYDPDLPWEKGVYNETNTLLLDDSPHKSLTNPQYNAIFPVSFRFTDVMDNSLGAGGDLRIYLEGLAGAENVQEYVKQNPFGQRAITEKNLSWKYYLKVIEAVSSPPRQRDDHGNDTTEKELTATNLENFPVAQRGDNENDTTEEQLGIEAATATQSSMTNRGRSIRRTDTAVEEYVRASLWSF